MRKPNHIRRRPDKHLSAAYVKRTAQAAVDALPPPGASTLDVQDEGVSLTTTPTSIDFVGAGVTASTVGNDVTVTIPGGGSSVAIEDEGVELTAAVTRIDFAGAGVTVTEPSPNEVLVTISGGGGSSVAVEDEGGELTAAVTRIDFAGAGVTATEPSADEILVTIPGYTDEQARDAIGAALVAGTDITITVNDGADTITIASTAAGGSGVWEHVETLSPSATTTVNSEAFAGQGYVEIKFVIQALTVATDDSDLSIRYKLNGAYKTAGSYHYSLMTHSAASGTVDDAEGSTATSIFLNSATANFGIGADTLEDIVGEVRVFNPDGTAKPKRATFHLHATGQTGASFPIFGGGTYVGTDAANALEGVQFLCNNNMTGTIQVYGLTT